MSLIIRTPTHDDLPWLAAQCRLFDTFFNAKHSLIPKEPGALEAQLRGFIDNPTSFPWWIADRPSVGPVGFIGGALHDHLFNPAVRVLSELFWWVTPSERGGRAGFMLLSTFTLFGQANADMVVMTLESNSPVKFGTLEHFGYRVKETNFILEV